MNQPQDIAALRAALKSENFMARLNAIQALGRMRDAAAVPDLLDALHDPDGAVLWAAADALQAIGDETAVKGLIAALEADTDMVRMAAGALGRIGDPSAVPALIEQLAHSDIRVCTQVLEALECIATPEALSAARQWRAANRNRLCRHRLQDTIANFTPSYPCSLIIVTVFGMTVCFLVTYFGFKQTFWNALIIACWPVWLGLAIGFVLVPLMSVIRSLARKRTGRE